MSLPGLTVASMTSSRDRGGASVSGRALDPAAHAHPALEAKILAAVERRPLAGRRVPSPSTPLIRDVFDELPAAGHRIRVSAQVTSEPLWRGLSQASARTVDGKTFCHPGETVLAGSVGVIER